jgi:hypothetical protein
MDEGARYGLARSLRFTLRVESGGIDDFGDIFRI